MSSTDFIHIKQLPVVNRLHDAIAQAQAYANAICDNAHDDRIPIPLDLVASVQADCDQIINALSEAAAQ